MKKILALAVAVAFFGLNANAQKEDLKVAKNSVEIGFNPFSNNFKTFQIDDLKYRHFWGDNAIRVRANFGLNTDKTGTKQEYVLDAEQGKSLHQVGNTESWNKANKTNFGLAIGYERHFNVSRRVDLYAGAELGYQGCFVSSKSYSKSDLTQYDSNDKDILGYATSESESKTKKASGAYNSVVLNAFTGIDFYIYKGLYLGAELGLGYQYKTAPDAIKTGKSSAASYDKNRTLQASTNSETTYSNHVYTTNTSTTVGTTTSSTETKIRNAETIDQHHSFNLRVEPALRIGWRF